MIGKVDILWVMISDDSFVFEESEEITQIKFEEELNISIRSRDNDEISVVGKWGETSDSNPLCICSSGVIPVIFYIIPMFEGVAPTYYSRRRYTRELYRSLVVMKIG